VNPLLAHDFIKRLVGESTVISVPKARRKRNGQQNNSIRQINENDPRWAMNGRPVADNCKVHLSTEQSH
jgi:hypothetical protein